ncbi:ABC transporter substrate-binding protein [Allopusillimonas ginsengisoli]|uniref:ABC transporter substrate-binding protein n=1 Tax=Allopusillimonas ginsengisoli TaxID=453575 RepID=UPI0014312AFF|nr:extracellular solute-binding protein [Allopusillimonas ginsengisoli]
MARVYKFIIGVIAGVGIGVGCLNSNSFASSPSDVKEISVLLWGTTWTILGESLAKEFEKETGIKVRPVTQASSGEGLIKLRFMKDKPLVDVWFTTKSVAERASSDTQLFADIPVASMQNLDNLMDGALRRKYVGLYYYPLLVLWREDLLKEDITSWEDLWTRNDLKGKVGIPDMNMFQAQFLLVANRLGDGQEPDIMNGFQRIRELKPQIGLIYGSDSQARQAVASGQIAALVTNSKRVKELREAGFSIGAVSPAPSPVGMDVMMIINGPKQEAAAKFVDFLMRESSQKIVAERLFMGPVNNAVHPAQELAEILPQAADTVEFDDAMINSNIGKWMEQFNKTVN